MEGAKIFRYTITQTACSHGVQGVRSASVIIHILPLGTQWCLVLCPRLAAKSIAAVYTTVCDQEVIVMCATVNFPQLIEGVFP